MELSIDQEIEAAIARAMPKARRIFGRSARIRWRDRSLQVGFCSEFGFHLRGSAYLTPMERTYRTLTAFRSALDVVATEAVNSVRPVSDDPKP